MNSYATNEAMGTVDNMLQGCLMLGEILLKLKNDWKEKLNKRTICQRQQKNRAEINYFQSRNSFQFFLSQKLRNKHGQIKICQDKTQSYIPRAAQLHVTKWIKLNNRDAGSFSLNSHTRLCILQYKQTLNENYSEISEKWTSNMLQVVGGLDKKKFTSEQGEI